MQAMMFGLLAAILLSFLLSKTITTVTRGEFKENMELQKQFLAMVKD